MQHNAVVILLAPALLTALIFAGPEQSDSTGHALHARAVQLEAAGNHQAALSLLWEAAGLAPNDPDIQNHLGEALDRLGALEASIDAFQRALAAKPDFRKAANNLILTLVKAGRGPEAVERARAIVDAAPRDPNAHFTLALAQTEQDIEGSIGSFGRVLELDPRHTLARYNLALALKRADRQAEAIEELKRALAIEPRADVHYTLGVIHWQQGEMDKAIDSLRRAIDRDSRHVDAHYTLGTVLKQARDWRGAIAALQRAIQLRPSLWSAHYTLGQVLQLSGDERGARARMAEADRLRRRDELEREAGVWTAVGIARFEARDTAGAIESLRRAVAVLDVYAPAHYQLGRVLQSLGRHDDARAAFTRAHTLNPSLVPPGTAR
jgi:tetratricopeptide (TPR) repeat protein